MKTSIDSKKDADLRRRCFDRLYEHYTEKNDKFRGQDQANIRETCAKARTWGVAPERIGEAAVRKLIIEKANGAADTGEGTISSNSDVAIFYPFLCSVLCHASKTNAISHRMFNQWLESFFTGPVQRKHWLVFNRVVFVCFPTQFCSVVDVDRLRKVCGKLADLGVIDRPGRVRQVQLTDTTNWADDVLDSNRPPCEDGFMDMDWFDLCEYIVPIVQKVFPDRDYADHSTFLAAMGDALN